MKIHAISQSLPHARYQRCPQCDTLFSLPDVKSDQSAHCPRCCAKIIGGRDWSLSRLTVMALAMLVLMPFAFTLPLVEIRLLGMHIEASLLGGIMQMAEQGNVMTASMVAFCTLGAPVAMVAGIGYLSLGKRLGLNTRPLLIMLEKVKEWVMFDVYLVGIAVASIKVQDYASLEIGYGLAAYLTLTVLSLLTLIHLDVEQLWQHFYPQKPNPVASPELRVCLNCHNSGFPDARGRCPRCHTPLDYRRRHSLQKSWSALIASVILLIPANLLPISEVWLNGSRRDDTIFSGILGLASGNVPVAMVVFIASILVPFIKVLVMLTLLLSIHFRCEQGLKTRMRLLRAVSWIGRWSMLDLFVISLTMSLVNRDQLLAFTMGPAAFYFGAAVILTIMAVEWLDSRLLWDAHATGTADYVD